MFFWKFFAAGNLTQLTWIKSLKTSKFFRTLKFCIKLGVYPAKETRNLLWKNTSDFCIANSFTYRQFYYLYPFSQHSHLLCFGGTLNPHSVWNVTHGRLGHAKWLYLIMHTSTWKNHTQISLILSSYWVISWFSHSIVTPEVSLKQQSCHIYFLMALMDGWEGWAGVFPPAHLLSPSPLCTWAAHQVAPEQPLPIAQCIQTRITSPGLP